MKKEVDVQKEQGFPWKALVVYVVVLLTTITIDFFATDFINTTMELTEEMNPAPTVGGSIFAFIFAAFGIVLQYAFTKYPTEWISQEQDIYKNEIWSALFYSGSIAIVLSWLVTFLNLEGNLSVSSLISAITTGLFLFFYFSGQEKEAHIRKAIAFVQLIWLFLGISIEVITDIFLSYLPV